MLRPFLNLMMRRICCPFSLDDCSFVFWVWVLSHPSQSATRMLVLEYKHPHALNGFSFISGELGDPKKSKVFVFFILRMISTNVSQKSDAFLLLLHYTICFHFFLGWPWSQLTIIFYCTPSVFKGNMCYRLSFLAFFLPCCKFDSTMWYLISHGSCCISWLNVLCHLNWIC